MIKKFFVTLLATAALFTSCKSDDDSVKELNAEQQNSLDDIAIEEYLNLHYFHPNSGKITRFDTVKGNEDDKYTALSKLAIKDPIGYYYIKNPDVKAEGPSIVSNDESQILTSYDAKIFTATNDEDYKYKFGAINDYANTINSGDGSAQIDPEFYYYKPTETEIKNGVKREYRELKYFVEALKNFKSTQRDGNLLYKFQGAIILPSRLAYGREKIYTGSMVTNRHAYRNSTFVINFELNKVTTPRPTN